MAVRTPRLNARRYGKRLIFQSTRKGYECDQILIMKADGSNQKLVSTGKGRTTCGYSMASFFLLVVFLSGMCTVERRKTSTTRLAPLGPRITSAGACKV